MEITFDFFDILEDFIINKSTVLGNQNHVNRFKEDNINF